MEKTYPYVSLGWNIFTSEAFSKGKPTRISRRFGDFYWGCRHTRGLIIPWTSSCQEVRRMRMYVLQLLWSFWWASLVVQMVKHLPAMQETHVWSLGWEDPLEKEVATHFSTLPGKFHGQEPGRLQSMGSQKVGHNWATWPSWSFWVILLGTYPSLKYPEYVAQGLVSFFCKGSDDTYCQLCTLCGLCHNYWITGCSVKIARDYG